MRDRVAHDSDYAHVSITPRWDRFENFLSDMGEKPVDKTLDRKDNFKGYCKENCRWATTSEQMNNTTANVFLEYGGETLTISQWASKLGMNYKNLFSRVHMYKWPLQQAFTAPIRRWPIKEKP